jgi:predicted HTH transcriptional regulator
MEYFGHVLDKPKQERKYPNKKSYYVKKEKPDFEGFIKSKSEVTALDLARQFLISEQTCLLTLRKFAASGLIEKIPCGVHDKQVWKVKNA